MAAKVVWLRAALADLERIGETIEATSPAYASSVVKKLYDATQDLSRFPRMGRRVPEWDDDAYRERIVYSYRVIYRIESEERIALLGFIHGARLLKFVTVRSGATTPAQRHPFSVIRARAMP